MNECMGLSSMLRSFSALICFCLIVFYRSRRLSKRGFPLCQASFYLRYLPVSTDGSLCVHVEEVTKCTDDKCYYKGVEQGKCVPKPYNIVLPVIDSNCKFQGFSAKTISVDCECKAFEDPKTTASTSSG